MANTVTIRQLFDDGNMTVTHVYILGDGSGEQTNTVIQDCTALEGAGVYRSIIRIQGDQSGFITKVNFDQTTPSIAAVLPDGRDFDFQFSYDEEDIVPVSNPKGSGTTGKITITTVGLGSGDTGFFVITSLKKPLTAPYSYNGG